MPGHSDVVTVGETMALLTTSDSPPDVGSTYSLGFGGAESNVCVGLARLGHSVAWVSALGHDNFGQMIRRGLGDERVNLFVRDSPTRPTGLMVKSLSTSAARPVTYYRAHSAASTLGLADLDRVPWEGARLLHLTGILPALSEATAELFRALISEAARRRVAVSVDINYRAGLWSADEAREALSPHLAQIDLLFGDSAELALLLGVGAEDDRDLARRAADRGPATVVVKRGERGAAVLAEGGWEEFPAHRVEVVDTVGAGDAFVAGFLSGLLDDEPVSERAKRAIVCGGWACTHRGDWEGTPTRNELTQVMTGVQT